MVILWTKYRAGIKKLVSIARESAAVAAGSVEAFPRPISPYPSPTGRVVRPAQRPCQASRVRDRSSTRTC